MMAMQAAAILRSQLFRILINSALELSSSSSSLMNTELLTESIVCPLLYCLDHFLFLSRLVLLLGRHLQQLIAECSAASVFLEILCEWEHVKTA